MKRKISLLLFIAAFFISFTSKATIVYVDSAHTGGIQNGTSWATAFSGFQAGVNVAHAGDSVWVARGTYQPPFHYYFYMKKGVKIFGGFSGQEANFNERDWMNNKTALINNFGGQSVVRNVDNNLTPSSLLDGFMFIGNQGQNGIAVFNWNSSPSISNCRFYKNICAVGQAYGGAIYNINCTPIISNCIFEENRAAYGGAIFNNMASPKIVNCVFLKNGATDMGGAIYNWYSNIYIINCTFYENWSSFGTTICNIDTSDVVVSNTVMSGAHAGIYSDSTSLATVTYSLIQGMAADLANNNLDGAANPMFVDESSDNFNLQDLSPCINAGNNNIFPNIGLDLLTTRDIAGQARLRGGNVDIGAYENQNQTETGLFNNPDINISEIAITPNPATDIIYINFTDDKLVRTRATLCDLYGKTVREITLNSKTQQVSLSGLCTGVYILRTITGGSVKIIKA